MIIKKFFDSMLSVRKRSRFSKDKDWNETTIGEYVEEALSQEVHDGRIEQLEEEIKMLRSTLSKLIAFVVAGDECFEGVHLAQMVGDIPVLEGEAEIEIYNLELYGEVRG